MDMTHVPYNGAGPAALALIGNQLPIGIIGLPPVAPYLCSTTPLNERIRDHDRHARTLGAPTLTAQCEPPGTPETKAAPAFNEEER